MELRFTCMAVVPPAGRRTGVLATLFFASMVAGGHCLERPTRRHWHHSSHRHRHGGADPDVGESPDDAPAFGRIRGEEPPAEGAPSRLVSNVEDVPLASDSSTQVSGRVFFAGDFSSVCARDKRKFLADCSDELYPVVCTDCSPEPIRLTLAAKNKQLLDRAIGGLMRHGLSIGGYPFLEALVDVQVYGDPHVTNLQGHRFDLHQSTGQVTLLQIPKGAEAAETLLSVVGHTKTLGGACSRMYLDAVNLTGKWAFERNRAGYFVKVEPNNVRPDHPIHKRWFRFGPGVRVMVTHGITDTGVLYINLRIAELAKTDLPIGGLLASENHKWAESWSPDCQKQTSLLAIEGAPKTVTYISASL